MVSKSPAGPEYWRANKKHYKYYEYSRFWLIRRHWFCMMCPKKTAVSIIRSKINYIFLF